MSCYRAREQLVRNYSPDLVAAAAAAPAAVAAMRLLHWSGGLPGWSRLASLKPLLPSYFSFFMV